MSRTVNLILVVSHWEAEPRREALVRSAHHPTSSIGGNPLSLQEVTDLLTVEGAGPPTRYPLAGGEA